MRLFLNFIYISFIVFVISSCGGDKKFSKTENIQVIPKNAAVIIEGRDLKKTYNVINDVEFSKLFTESNEFSSLFSSIAKLNIELEKNGASVWVDKDYSLSIHTTGSQEFGHLFIIDDIRSDAMKSIERSFSSSKIRIEQYENQKIYHLSSLNLSFVQVDQFFILSNEDILIKDAIRQHAANTDLPTDEHFQDAFRSADRSELFNVYVQTKELLNLFGMTYKSSFSFLSSIDEWLALDVNIDNDRILMSGICTAKDNNRLHKMMFGTSGRKSEIFEYLPSNTHYLLTKLFPNFEQYMSSRIKTLEHDQRLKAWKSYKKNSEYNVEDFLKTFGDEYTYAICGSEINPNNAIGVVKLNNLENAKRFLKISDLPKYRSYEIRELQNNKVLDFVLGDFFKDFSNAKCVIIDDYVIFANSLSNLKSTINDHLSGNTLAEQETFNDLKDELSSKSNIWMYISEDALEKYPEQMSREKYREQQREVGQKIKNLGKVFTQIKVEDDYFQINIVSKNPKKEWKPESTKSDWSLELDHAFSRKPNKLWNHVDKTYELAIQDQGNVIYLISDLGKILWKKQWPDQIIGDIKQIDIYKNNRFQMLFQTKSEIVLLDRNGNLVDGYPIQLPSYSSGEMSVLDYDKTKNYRLLVPCENHLAMYNQRGDIVKGWKAFNQENAIISQPKHAVYNSKDYISVFTNSNMFLVYKRNGELRFKSKLPQKPHSKSEIILKQSEEYKAELLAESNDYMIIENANEVETKPGFKNNLIDYKNNGRSTYFLSKDRIVKHSGDDEFEYEFDVNNTDATLSLTEELGYSCVVDVNKEKAYVFNKELELMKNFPIYGLTPPLLTTMNSSAYIKLFVGGDDGTLYSYQISK